MLISFRVARAIIVATILLLLSATPAGAVLDGAEDSSNTYANVGLLEMKFDDHWAGVCTGTLVREDVVLTAAHCVALAVAPGGVGVENIRITFDPTPDASSERFYAVAAQVHPDWSISTRPRGNAKILLGPGAEDVALVWLDAPAPGVEPAPIVEGGGLDAADLTSETFTIVGYGVTDFVTGSAVSAKPEVIFSGRNYKEVTVITEHEAIADRYLKITASTCYGDSGGPLFRGRTVVALNNWTTSRRCAAPSFSYRLDAPLAQSFLSRWLD
jgi:hypothetical protein